MAIFFLVYAFFICNFLFGNHDWGMIFSPVLGYAKTWQSRPFAFLPLQVWQGFYLPVLTPCFSLLAWFAAGVLFLTLLPASREIRGRSFLLVLLLFVLSPTLLGRLYYEGAGIGENVALCCFLLGANFCVHAKGKASLLLAVVLFGFALGVNQCIVNTFWTVLLILLLCWSARAEKVPLFRYGGAFAAALVIYVLMIKFVLPVQPFYNNQLAGAGAFLKNLLPQLKASVACFWQTQPPMNRLFKALFSCICLAGFVLLLARPEKAAARYHAPRLGPIPVGVFVLRLLLIAALVLTNNVAAYISGDASANTGNLRMDYYSAPFILSFCATVALGAGGLWGRLFTAAAALLVILSMGSDARALQVWKITIDADLFYVNRMLARIEAAPAFDAGRSWRILALGERPAFGNRFWPGYGHGTLELQRPQHLGRNFAEIFNYIAPQLDFGNFTGARDTVCARHRGFLEQAPAWPKPGALLIDAEAGLIVLVLEEKAARLYCAR
ncbi:MULTISPECIES: hypothetical protein [unclassified Desulfovibrio]|uniref:hypothetical protein n=1 Tax=unclassified Desulfovibrio TaxID=2593640 RepID=UPI0013EDA1C6|nr:MULTISPECIES: hypothetical protein [unclassified Desulfovibrio]